MNESEKKIVHKAQREFTPEPKQASDGVKPSERAEEEEGDVSTPPAHPSKEEEALLMDLDVPISHHSDHETKAEQPVLPQGHPEQAPNEPQMPEVKGSDVRTAAEFADIAAEGAPLLKDDELEQVIIAVFAKAGKAYPDINKILANVLAVFRKEYMEAVKEQAPEGS